MLLFIASNPMFLENNNGFKGVLRVKNFKNIYFLQIIILFVRSKLFFKSERELVFLLPQGLNRRLGGLIFLAQILFTFSTIFEFPFDIFKLLWIKRTKILFSISYLTFLLSISSRISAHLHRFSASSFFFNFL